MRVCDICGRESKQGMTLKKAKWGVLPWKRKLYMCDKCWDVLQNLILGYRRRMKY